ncbi:hypothetical protein AWH69_12140 [Janibacter melonis]|uniref:Acetone carboxylase n=1 Tax=Janibacter melonis TaxID=262209 RepID=A0A176QBQ8_9MICO|nr:hypothetical protein [Janibacter melonis]MBD5831121.1 hypothetical protein [Janibacter melonis]OAB87110.1 hypothetical protein AWH69_12140 [Janibacter melonis]
MSPADEPLVCSAKGCRRTAVRAVVWRNPRLHDETRRKVWLACEEHTSTLHEHLSVRGFPVRLAELDAIPPEGQPWA